MTISVTQFSTLYERIEKQAKRERLISDLTTAVCSTFELKVIFNIAAREITKVIGVDRCLILEFINDNEFGICSDCINENLTSINLNDIKEDYFTKNNALFCECRETLEPIVIDDTSIDSPYSEALKPI